MTFTTRSEMLEMAAQACSIIYTDPRSLVQIPRASNVQVFEGNDVLVAVFDWNGRTVVACQGSNTPDDWLRYNLRLSMNHGIHSGFDKAAKAVSTRVVQAVLLRNQSVILCGHSLGGAIAQRLVTLLRDYDRVHGVFTFGSPRVYSKELASEYDKIFGDVTVRLVLRHDFITTIPWALGAYAHAGREVILNDDATFGKRTTAWFLTAALRVIPKLVGWVQFDHNMDQYAAAVAGGALEIARQSLREE